MPRPFMVIRSRGPAWDDSMPIEGQKDWPAHADFMDALAAERFVRLGGPIEGTRDVLLIVEAEDAAGILRRLAADPWARNGLLVEKECRPWILRLGSLARPDGVREG